MLKKSIDLNLNSLYDIADKRITMTKQEIAKYLNQSHKILSQPFVKDENTLKEN